MVSTLSDSDLVCDAQKGEKHALEELTERYYSTVYAVALSQLHDVDAANDLAQEVFLRVTLRIQDLRDGSKYCAWLIRMTRNLALDWKRRGNTRSKLLPLVPLDQHTTEMLKADQPDPREKMIQDDDTREVLQAVSKLPERQREIVLLYYQENLDQQEIAERLGVHRSTISRQLEKSLTFLRNEMEEKMRRALAPRKSSKRMVRRAAILSITTAALSVEAKASILATTATKTSVAASTVETATAGVGFLSFLKSTFLSCFTGAGTIGTAKTIGSLVLSTALVGGSAYTVYQKIQANEVMNLPPGITAAQVPNDVDEFVQNIPGDIQSKKITMGEPASLLVPYGDAMMLDFDPDANPFGVDNVYFYAPGRGQGTQQAVELGNENFHLGFTMMENGYYQMMNFDQRPGHVEFVTFEETSDGVEIYFHLFFDEAFGESQEAAKEAYQNGEIPDRVVVQKLMESAEKLGFLPTDPKAVKKFEESMKKAVDQFLVVGFDD